jgi:hypothetical protein
MLSAELRDEMRGGAQPHKPYPEQGKLAKEVDTGKVDGNMEKNGGR